MKGFVPNSVRNGSRWVRFKWWATRWRGPMALRIAPWLGGIIEMGLRYQHLVDALEQIRTDPLCNPQAVRIADAALRFQPKDKTT